MGHRSFKRKATQPADETSDSPVPEAEEMSNGLTKVTDEQRRVLEEGRRLIRDQVSSRMGELLLRGYTMLDAYCSICSGILMQDRLGNRECVQCELLRGELNTPSGAGRIVGQIPLDASAALDHIALSLSDESESASPSQVLVTHPVRASTASTARESAVVGSEYRTEPTIVAAKEESPDFQNQLNEMKMNLDVRSLLGGTHTSASPERQSQQGSRTSVRPMKENLLLAQRTIEEKLRWCCDALSETEDLERIVMLQKAIKGSIEILQMLK